MHALRWQSAWKHCSVPVFKALELLSYPILCASGACSFLNRESRVISSRTVLPFCVQSLCPSLASLMLSARCLSFMSSARLPICSAVNATGNPICTDLPLSACTGGMLPLTSGSRLGGTAPVRRGFGLWRFSSGGSSGFGNPFGTGIPFACRPPGTPDPVWGVFPTRVGSDPAAAEDASPVQCGSCSACPSPVCPPFPVICPPGIRVRASAAERFRSQTRCGPLLRSWRIRGKRAR